MTTRWLILSGFIDCILSSETESEPVEFLHKSWLILCSHFLSERVLVEFRSSSSKLIRFFLIVVLFEVANNFRGHMSVIWSRSHSWEKVRSSFLMRNVSNSPAWADDSKEKHPYQKPTGFTILYLNRMQMHMELWSNITIECSVHILKMMSSRIFVGSVWNRVGFVEAAATCCHHQWSVHEHTLSRPQSRSH